MNILDKFHHWRRRRRWNKQYRKGRWESLKSDIEAHRYQQIIAYLKKYGVENARILDLGCGDGVLNDRMRDESYEYFMGIDFSSVSIDKALSKNLPRSDYRSVDIIKFKPEQQFDVIIFNEVFYYIPDSEKNRIMKLMFDTLTENGIIITSIFREGIGCWEHFRENPKLDEIDFVTVRTQKETTYWKIGVYKLRDQS
jgi:2-polyprenyl-3-methyl-5-hydroxy-6-metoxy-1,4-benzoquinol methylase